MRHNIFPDILNKTVYGILFILTQNVYLYTPAFLHAPFIPVFFLFPPVYKNFYFPYSAMFYAVRSRTYVFHLLSKTGILILNSLIGSWRFHSKNNFSISRMRIALFCVNDGCWKFSVVLYGWFFQNIFFLAKVNEIKEMKTFYMQHLCKWSFGYYGESQDK